MLRDNHTSMHTLPINDQTLPEENHTITVFNDKTESENRSDIFTHLTLMDYASFSFHYNV